MGPKQKSGNFKKTYFSHLRAKVDYIVCEGFHRAVVRVSPQHLADVFLVVPYFGGELFRLQQIFLAESRGYLLYLQRKC